MISSTLACLRIAEFRGPGVHHNFDDSDSGYDVDMDQSKGKTFGIGGYKGRVIFLGDGTEVLTDADDNAMFESEKQDLDSQVAKTGSSEDDGTTEDQTNKKEGTTDGKADKGTKDASEEAEAKAEKIDAAVKKDEDIKV